jgi:EAL domain-containing protein (putative c-di-GMP-specific phosphodiesterase class I)
LNPALLELELTESILIKDTEKVLSLVQRLKSQGVKFSIDDFGTGYSSLSYLKQFNVDKLKIDQSFVRDMADDPNDAAIVNAIIQMAKSLNLTTIAEGVEDARQLELLRQQNCDEVQGYHFARPMPADEFTAFIAKRGAAPAK